MRRCMMILASVAVLALMADAAMAQPPGGREKPRGQRQGGPNARGQGQRPGPPGGPGGRGPGGGSARPQFPLMVALDADGDGQISAEEINNAVAALKKLDKDGDGKLSREELRPEFPGGRGGAGGGGGPGGRGPSGSGGRGQGGHGGQGFVERLMRLDRNEDGKVSKDEIPEQMPERMQQMLRRADTNGDEAIDKEEAEAAAEKIEQMRRERGGAKPKGRADGDRPRRPE